MLGRRGYRQGKPLPYDWIVYTLVVWNMEYIFSWKFYYKCSPGLFFFFFAKTYLIHNDVEIVRRVIGHPELQDPEDTKGDLL